MRIVDFSIPASRPGLSACILLGTCLFGFGPASAQTFDSRWETRDIATGVVLRSFDDVEMGARRIVHVLEVNSSFAGLELRPIWSGAGVGRSTAAVASEHGAVAAVNAGYHDNVNWVHVGELRIAGEVLAEQSWEADSRATLGWNLGGGLNWGATAAGQVMPDVWHAIGAGPRLIRDGAVAVEAVENTELFGHADYRRARTAVAQARGGMILLVTLDERGGGVGMTFSEFAQFLLGIGAVQAMNLDGGSSTTMWVDTDAGGEVVAPPSGYAPAIMSALAVIPSEGRPRARTAGGNRTLNLGDSTTFDGTPSSDPEGDPLNYRWFVEGPPEATAGLPADSQSVVAFTPDAVGRYVVKLVVDDGEYLSTPREVVVQVNDPPSTPLNPTQPTPGLDSGGCGTGGSVFWAIVLLPSGLGIRRRRRTA